MARLHFVTLLLGWLVSRSLAVNPVEIRGNHFFDSVTGERFVIVGLAYQPKGESGYDFRSGRDTLSDAKICLRDAIVMQNLGINTIRVYNLNPYLNHDECVSIFNAAGIYLALDVNSPFPGESINRFNPSESYHAGYITRLTAMVDAFAGFPNLLLFFAGNEVVNDIKSAKMSPPYMRAVQRDIKQYIKTRANRSIPVGYAASDDSLRRTMHRYLSCGTDVESGADFYGLNSYEWCLGSTWETSGYGRLVNSFDKSPIPIFFSEYGCNAKRPRNFAEVEVLFGEIMGPGWSGGIIYEYSEERSGYGLVTLGKNNEVTLSKEFENLRLRHKDIDREKLNAYVHFTRLREPCTEDKIVDDDSRKLKFNYSMNLPANPLPSVNHKNYTAEKKAQGSLVEVTETKTPYRILSSTGVELKNMELKVYVPEEHKPGNKTKPDIYIDDNDVKGDDSAGLATFHPSSSLGILMILFYLFLCQ